PPPVGLHWLLLQRPTPLKPSQWPLTVGCELVERMPMAVGAVPPMMALWKSSGVAAAPPESLMRTPSDSLVPPPPLMKLLLMTAPIDPVTVTPAVTASLVSRLKISKPSSTVALLVVASKVTPPALLSVIWVTQAVGARGAGLGVGEAMVAASKP